MFSRAGFLMALMAAVAIGVAAITPRPSGVEVIAPVLDEMLPDRFGDWRRLTLASPVLPLETELGRGEAVAYRAYRDRLGRVVTLVVAYGPPLGDSVRLHRPEVCYRAQGFEVRSKTVASLEMPQSEIALVQLQTRNTTRAEAVTYWLRFGERYSVDNPTSVAFSGRADGALVRVSSTGEGASEFALHKAFLKSFYDALEPPARRILTVDAS